MKSHQEKIDMLIDRIVAEVNPLKVLIFGSVVRGDSNFDSDVDILVVMPEGVHKRKTAQLLYKKIINAGIPFDIMVSTPIDLEKNKNNIGLIYRSILKEGKEVYVR